MAGIDLRLQSRPGFDQAFQYQFCCADTPCCPCAQSFLADLQRAKQGLCVEVPAATVVFVMASPPSAGAGTGSGGPRLIGLVLPAVG